MDNEKNRGAFTKWLLVDKTERQSRMIDRAQGEKIIQYLRDVRELGQDDPYMQSNYGSTFRNTVKQRGFKLLAVVGLGDILCLPMNQAAKHSTESHAMLGQFRQVIFKEDMFDVILNAHVQGTKHLGYKGTFKKLNETYCCIPRLVVWKFVGLCNFCAVHHSCYANKSHRELNEKETPKAAKKHKRKIEFSDAFLTRCQIDIIDMSKDPDGPFSFIGHFFDHHTKYNVLFPLKMRDSAHVARKVCRHVIGHFGLPKIIYSNMPRDYIDELIHEILQLWSTNMPIINGDPANGKALHLIQQRQRTIVTLIETLRRKQNNSSAWTTWLPSIQYSLNTNEFEQNTSSSYDVVYKARPRSYNYSSSSSQTPREEALMYSEDEDEQQSSETLQVSENRNEPCSLVTLLAEKWPSTSTAKMPMQIVTVPRGAIASQEILPLTETVADAGCPADPFEEKSLSTVVDSASYETVSLQSSSHHE